MRSDGLSRPDTLGDDVAAILGLGAAPPVRRRAFGRSAGLAVAGIASLCGTVVLMRSGMETRTVGPERIVAAEPGQPVVVPEPRYQVLADAGDAVATETPATPTPRQAVKRYHYKAEREARRRLSRDAATRSADADVAVSSPVPTPPQIAVSAPPQPRLAETALASIADDTPRLTAAQTADDRPAAAVRIETVGRRERRDLGSLDAIRMLRRQ